MPPNTNLSKQHYTSSQSSSDDDTLSYDNILKYILNEHNKSVPATFIEKTLAAYNIKHSVKQLMNFQIAMVHTSYLKRDLTQDRIVKLIKEKNLVKIPDSKVSSAMPLQTVSYERLECLGDSVIHMAVLEYLFERYPDQQEGFLTRLRTKIENKETLANISRSMKLNQYAVIARNLEIIGNRDDNDNILEDIFESFVGALFLETDYYLCKQFIINVIERELDLSVLIYVETNYKDMLLQYYHKMRWPDPEYGMKHYSEDNNRKIFNMYVKGFTKANINTWDIVGKGSGVSKQKGQQEAAYYALVYFGVINNSDVASNTSKPKNVIQDDDIIELSDN